LLDKHLQTLLAPALTTLGYELLGIERISQGKRGQLLRIYIDHPEGISVEDCERASYQISGILDVENPIAGQYDLEVSSPGIDRPLFTLEHFERFIGHKVALKLRQPVENRRKFTGILQQVQDQTIVLHVDGSEYLLPYAKIEKAHLAVAAELLAKPKK